MLENIESIMKSAVDSLFSRPANRYDDLEQLRTNIEGYIEEYYNRQRLKPITAKELLSIFGFDEDTGVGPFTGNAVSSATWFRALTAPRLSAPHRDNKPQ
jgi:hypothetical protein